MRSVFQTFAGRVLFVFLLTVAACCFAISGGTAEAKAAPPLTVDYAANRDHYPRYHECVINSSQPRTEAIFIPAEPLTEFHVLRLTYQESPDGIAFRPEVLFRFATLEPTVPLTVTTSFNGSIPDLGVSFTDANGKKWALSVSISGQDGSLCLDEIHLVDAEK